MKSYVSVTLQSTPRYEPPPEERASFFGEGCEVLEQAFGFRRYSTFCKHVKEEVRESVDKNFSPSSALTEI